MRFKGKKPIFNIKDTWSLDCTLNPIIAEGLKKFREVMTDKETTGSFGVPSTIYHDFKVNVEDGEEAIQKGFEIWVEQIDKMIYAFEDEKNEPDTDNYNFTFEFLDKPEGAKSLKPTDEDEYQRYREDCDKHEAKVQEGLNLFARYYKNLWWQGDKMSKYYTGVRKKQQTF